MIIIILLLYFIIIYIFFFLMASYLHKKFHRSELYYVWIMT